jgi:hypothetical protein
MTAAFFISFFVTNPIESNPAAPDFRFEILLSTRLRYRIFI